MGLTPIVTGLALLPGNILSLFAALIAGRLFDKMGARKIAIAGYVVLILGLFCLSRVSLSTTLIQVIVFHCCVLISIQFITIPIQTNSLNQLPNEYNAHGVGISNTSATAWWCFWFGYIHRHNGGNRRKRTNKRKESDYISDSFSSCFLGRLCFSSGFSLCYHWFCYGVFY